MAEKRTDEKVATPPGPEAERLKIDDDPEEALQRLLKAPPRLKLNTFLDLLGELEAGRPLSGTPTQIGGINGPDVYCFKDLPDCEDGFPVDLVHEMRDAGFVEGDMSAEVWKIAEPGRKFLKRNR